MSSTSNKSVGYPVLNARPGEEIASTISADGHQNATTRTGPLAWTLSERLRSGAVNALYGVADYVAAPVTMVVAAPFLIHRLGYAQYGVWMLAMSVVGSMQNLGSGFGDAAIRYVSKHRGTNDRDAIVGTIRATLTINLALGSVLMLVTLLGSGFAVAHLFKIDLSLQRVAVSSIRVSAVLLLVKSVESVFASTLRAFECYGPTVKISVAVRGLSVAAAVLVAASGHGVDWIMLCTLALSAAGLLLQIYYACGIAGVGVVLPAINRQALSTVATFGVFSWAQAMAGVVFSYADRFLVGAVLGMAPLAYYNLCVQVTQPIHGVAAAAFSFLFPHLSSRLAAGERDACRRIFRKAAIVNLALISILALGLVAFAKPLLTIWMGADFATHSHSLLVLLTVAFWVLGAAVVPHYTLLAFGNVRFVSMLNVLGGIICAVAGYAFMSWWGLVGAAVSRILYGVVINAEYFKSNSTIEKEGTGASAG